MSVSKSFTAVGTGPDLGVRPGESVSYSISGTFVGKVIVEQAQRGGWTPLVTATGAASGTLVIEAPGERFARVHVRCEAFTSGTIVTSLAEVSSIVGQELKALDGSVVLQTSEDGVTIPVGKTLTATAAALVTPALTSPAITTPTGGVHAIEATLTETAGAGTYTAAIPIPAGATILDIIINGVALWTASTSATLKVGDAGTDDGYYTGVDLKATDLLAGESLSFALAGGKAGAYIANSQVSPRYVPAGTTISAVVTTVGTGGTAGRTRMTVVYHVPVSADRVTATKA